MQAILTHTGTSKRNQGAAVAGNTGKGQDTATDRHQLPTKQAMSVAKSDTYGRLSIAGIACIVTSSMTGIGYPRYTKNTASNKLDCGELGQDEIRLAWERQGQGKNGLAWRSLTPAIAKQYPQFSAERNHHATVR